jgi:hypothetical protein
MDIRDGIKRMHELVRLISLRDWAVKLPGLDKGRKHSVFDGLCESTFQPVGALVLKRFKADCTAERSRIRYELSTASPERMKEILAFSSDELLEVEKL